MKRPFLGNGRFQKQEANTLADQITNYKCPSCGGPIHFSNSSQSMECEYCGSRFTISEIESYNSVTIEKPESSTVQISDSDSEWQLANGDVFDENSEGLKAFNCPSCGAELFFDETTVASSCPYCGNPTIVQGNVNGMLKPDLIIPFKLDKKSATEALRKHYQGKKLLPSSFTRENHIEEIKGVYVPFWLFDGEADADLLFNATRSRVTETRNERIISTDHYSLRRSGVVPFAKIPVDASSKMPDAHMDAIEPFDYSQLVPFSTAYLAGYLADRYDESMEVCSKRADDRAMQSAKLALQQTCVGYESVSPSGGSISLRRGKVYYALLPVWILNTKWHGQDFLFAMNGQTGKLIGDLPVDKGKYWKYFGLTTAIATVVATLILSLLK